MIKNNISSLIEKRREFVKTSKDNNFNFESVLSGIYSDPSHFIYEILQNAEDAGATKICFNLKKDELQINHNGREFNFNDVDGITGVGISTKKENLNAIGKFGVGFKSVFAITNTPIIHSGLFHFKIQDTVLPEIIEVKEGTDTIFILPFNHPKRSAEDVYKIIENKLANVSPHTLLFLSNICEINWISLGKRGFYYKKDNKYKNYKYTSVFSNTGKNETKTEYLILQREVSIGSNKTKVELGYKVDKGKNGKNEIVRETESKLVVFFPTERVTYLNFIIQGPYRTTPNRENIPFDDEMNKFLLEETAILVADSISLIKSLGLLTPSFLEVLPINPENNSDVIYFSIFKKVKEILKSDKPFLPSSQNHYGTANDSLLTRGSELRKLLTNNDLLILFGKKLWLSSEITVDRHRILRDYLSHELEIKEIEFDDFVKNISCNFLQKKSDKWMIGFYALLLEKRILWEKRDFYYGNLGILRRKKIIRLMDGSHIEPFDKNDNPQVYLPSGTKSKFLFVKETIINNKDSLRFLDDLGISTPDIFAEINESILPKYLNSNPKLNFSEYLNDIYKIFSAYQKEKESFTKKITKNLEDFYLILSENSGSSNLKFIQPKNAYIKTPELVDFFQGYTSISFISGKIYNKKINKNEFVDFLLLLGCENKPRRIKFQPSFSENQKRELRGNIYCTYEIEVVDFDLEGLQNFITNITKKRSLLLWKYILMGIGDYEDYPKSEFFFGSYKWFYYNHQKKIFEANFLRTLKNISWLYSKKGKWVKPKEVSISELSEEYKKYEYDNELLTSVFGFQIEAINKYIEKHGGFYISEAEKEKYIEFQKWKERNQTTEKINENTWTSEIDPKEITPKAITINPKRIRFSIGSNRTVTEKKEDAPSITNQLLDLKSIGKWGEEYVGNYLHEKYKAVPDIKVIWHNNEHDIGFGYDFSLKKGKYNICYIEVKSKIDDVPRFIEITGAQWRFAQSLFFEKKGDQYSIYIVSNSGKKNARISIINNPIKLWIEGKLFAHPVNLKL